MVVKGEVVDVYLADHDDKPVPATGHKGVAILMADGKSVRIVLEPAGDAKLSGKASAASAGCSQGRGPDHAGQGGDGPGPVQLIRVGRPASAEKRSGWRVCGQGTRYAPALPRFVRCAKPRTAFGTNPIWFGAI